MLYAELRYPRTSPSRSSSRNQLFRPTIDNINIAAAISSTTFTTMGLATPPRSCSCSCICRRCWWCTRRWLGAWNCDCECEWVCAWSRVERISNFPFPFSFSLFCSPPPPFLQKAYVANLVCVYSVITNIHTDSNPRSGNASSPERTATAPCVEERGTTAAAAGP